MKRLILLLVLLTAVPSVLHAEYPALLYRDNYIAGGDDDVKFRVSAEYPIFYPFSTGIYASYTETAFWSVYDKSAPFREFIHNPEAFYRLEEGRNIFDNSKLGIIDYITLCPIAHQSNGRDGENSRGINTYYGEMQISFGDEYNFGLRLKGFGYYNKSRYNRDIEKYIGYGEGELFFKVKSDNLETTLHKLYVKGSPGSDFKHGWGEAGGMFSLFTGYIQPKIFVSFFYGYAEDMVNYDKKQSQVRAGLAFLGR